MSTRIVNINEDLIARCMRGDRNSQFEIYGLYYRPMYNSSLRIVGNAETAEDIMQESFLTAFSKMASYRGEASFSAWLKKIVINQSLDFLRKKKVVFDELKENLQISDEEDAEPMIITTEEVKEAIAGLPDGFRTVLSLVLVEGYSHEEVSRMLGIRNVSSRTQFSRARQRLKEILLEKGKTKFREEIYE